jgi:hypothetical protein
LALYAAAIAGILVVDGLFALFAGRSAYGMQEQGSEDSRWRPSPRQSRRSRTTGFSARGSTRSRMSFPSDDFTDCVNWPDRVTAALRRHADWAACVAAKRPDCSEAPVPDLMDPLLNDETLVNGDIVSTPNGLKVFRGQSTVPHSLADFQ